MSQAAPCRFGSSCNRLDCWFFHPERQGGAPARTNAPLMTPLQSHLEVSVPAGAVGANSRVCRWGAKCHRPDCYYEHPEGRSVPESPAGGMSPTSQQQYDEMEAEMEEEGTFAETMLEDKTKEFNPSSASCTCCKGYIYACTDTTCVGKTALAVSVPLVLPILHFEFSFFIFTELGSCGCVFGTTENETWKDEWFAASRACKCCSGYVYRCKDAVCRKNSELKCISCRDGSI